MGMNLFNYIAFAIIPIAIAFIHSIKENKLEGEMQIKL